MVVSKAPPTRPIDDRTPNALQRLPKSTLVLRAGSDGCARLLLRLGGRATQGLLQRIEHKISGRRTADAPAHDAPCGDVPDEDPIQPSLPDRHASEVGHPKRRWSISA